MEENSRSESKETGIFVSVACHDVMHITDDGTDDKAELNMDNCNFCAETVCRVLNKTNVIINTNTMANNAHILCRIMVNSETEGTRIIIITKTATTTTTKYN